MNGNDSRSGIFAPLRLIATQDVNMSSNVTFEAIYVDFVAIDIAEAKLRPMRPFGLHVLFKSVSLP